MANQGQSKDQLGYVQLETNYGTIPNSTGTASLAGSNAFRMISLSTDADQGIIARFDKTGTLSELIGNAGRRSGKWAARCSLAGNGAAGTAPDIGPFLQALFGKAPTVVASTSVTYGLADLSPSVSIWNFRKPSTLTQQVALGAVVDQAIFNLGADVADIDMSGTALWVNDTDQFSGSDSTAKGGLTAFPSEPATPVTNGNMATGFTGAVTLDGNTYGTMRTARLTAKMNRDIPQDVYNNYYGAQPGQDKRSIGIEFDLYDDDSANLSSLKVKALSSPKVAVALSFQLGTIAGNIWTFSLPNVLLNAPKYNDGQRRWSVQWTGTAYASGITARDEFSLVLT